MTTLALARDQEYRNIDWSKYTSFKGYNPDWLEISVLSTDTFSTPAGICCEVIVDNEITVLPLKSKCHLIIT